MRMFNLYFRKCPALWKMHSYLRKHPRLYAIVLCFVIVFVPYYYRTIVELIDQSSRDRIPTITEYISEYVEVRLRLIDNFRRDGQGRVPIEISLKNTANVGIFGGRWKLYFNSIRPWVETEDLGCGMRIDHVNGLLFTLSPVSGNDVTLIPINGSIKCEFYGSRSVSKTDFLPNWYVTDGTPESKVAFIKSTMSEGHQFVDKFDKPNQWKRNPQDTYNPYTPSERYEMNERFKSGSHAETFKIIPTPRSSSIDSSNILTLDKNWIVKHSDEFAKAVTNLADTLSIAIRKDDTGKRSKIVSFIKTSDSTYGKEEYDLKIDPGTEQIDIIAKNPEGAFYGIQTLLALIGDDGKLPGANIRDKPRFSFRGLMVDVARNFKSKQTIMKLINSMSTYKMNKLHLHLSDDEGWRLEIPEIPQLTEVGSKRCHNNKYDLCLIPSLGSGPFVSMPGSGFYSVSDYREILKYASDRHVQVIPEIDMPGHAMAAVVSMNFRDSIRGKNARLSSYRLTDNIESSVISVQNWVGNSINPCLNTSYMFVEKILDTLINLHKDIQDLTLVHIGGDEVPHGVWDNSEACRKLSIGSHVSHSELKKRFMYTVADLAALRGLNIFAWEDGMYENGIGPYKRSNLKPTEVFINPWNNIWENGRGGRAYEFATEGYKVVLSQATNLYFDHPYEPDPEERGLYWATRYIDEETVFGFMPDDLFANAVRLRNGEPTDKKKICGYTTCPSTLKPRNIIGMEACIWGELIRTETQLYEMLFPRLLAVAERSWHKASWEDIDDVSSRTDEKLRDFASFVNRLGMKELPRLEKAGFSYRIPIPGAIVKDGILYVNSLYPNHKIVYSEGNKPPWYEIVNDKTELPKSYNSLYIKSVSKVSEKSSRAINVL